MNATNPLKRTLPLLLALALFTPTAWAPGADAQDADPDAGMSLKGGAEGTTFESLTIEGEDRIHIEFDRPTLMLQLDPLSVGGLDGASMELMLSQTEPDLVPPLLAESARQPSPFLGQPWLRSLASGSLVKFRPELDGVQRWSLLIADSRGDTVAVFAGERRPPSEITWDGVNVQGRPSLPGPTYSYVMTAWDKAGNKRNFVGEGFELPAYHVATPAGRTFLFAARHLAAGGYAEPRPPLDPPLLLEVASRINQEPALDGPIRIVVKARSYEQAARLGERVASCLARRVLGNPARIQTLTEVESRAPEDGAVIVVAGSS
ncbi:MAG: hypothetical protein JW819_02840 [Candidatus Krumholzibacteriota bacterium]|nr:hypothetical protein [Candidatus Krumholzibacteriota bacterium]